MFRFLFAFIAAMILCLPHSFAFSWQEDVAAETENMVHASGIESGMSYAEFKRAWQNRPGWTTEAWDTPAKYQQAGAAVYTATFQKTDFEDSTMRERMNVTYTKEHGVMFSALTFVTQDRKVADEICRYAEKRIKAIDPEMEREEYSSKSDDLEQKTVTWQVYDFETGEPSRYFSLEKTYSHMVKAYAITLIKSQHGNEK